MPNTTPIGKDALREALWICVEHNALHFGETHNTVVQGRAALAGAAAAAVPAIPDAITHTIQRALVKFSDSELERLRTLLEPENAAGAMFGMARIAARQNIDDADAALNWLAAAPKAAPAPQGAEGAVLSAVKLQARIWKQEARTQAAIVRDCYQLATDATGEPGDWNGSNPVREKIVALTEARDALVAALERAYFWMDAQADTQSKGGHATFDLMMLREERDAAKAAIDAARSKQEAK